MSVLTLTLWRSRTCPIGRRSEYTWPEFVSRFVAEPEIATRKESVAGFSLASFTNNRRALANVERVFALTLDSDDGSTSIDEAAGLFPGVRGVTYTTWSHTKEHPKTRAIFLFSRPVSPDEYARIWSWADERCTKRKHPIDAAARDASRLFYIPSYRPGGTYEFRSLEGEPLDVEEVIRQAPPTCALPRLAVRGIQKQHGGGGDRTASGADWRFVLGRMRVGDTDEQIARALARISPKAAAREDYLRRTIERARDIHEAALIRATVVRAFFDSRPALDACPPLARWKLDLVTLGGEVLRVNVVLPTPGNENARATFTAAFPGVKWTPSLATYEGWKRRGLLPLRGRQFDVATRGVGSVTWVRAVSNESSNPSRRGAR